MEDLLNDEDFYLEEDDKVYITKEYRRLFVDVQKYDLEQNLEDDE